MIPVAKPCLGPEEIEAVNKVLSSGMLAAGKYVRQFEEDFASYLGANHAVAVSSGTTALQAAMAALGIKDGDEVITTPFTFIATVNAILGAGAVPAFADINPATYNLDAESIKAALSLHPRAKAVLVVHLYGLCCDMDPIIELCRERGLLLIEDCAQVAGAAYKNKKAGTFGNIACFSFYATKNMTTGEGGMVVTGDSGLGEKVRLYINHGSSEKYIHKAPGFNYRMTDIAAAIGIEQLRKLDNFNEIRRNNAEYLTKYVQNSPKLIPPSAPENCRHIFHQYTLKAENRDDFLHYLENNKIGYGIHYPTVAYRQPYYKRMVAADISCPNAETVSGQVVSIPVYPALTSEELDYISKVIAQYN